MIGVDVDFFCCTPVNVGSVLDIIATRDILQLCVKIALGAWVMSVHRDRTFGEMEFDERGSGAACDKETKYC
jgi:hypothetical protein